MTEEELIFLSQQYKIETKYRNYFGEIITEMSNSEIAEMIIDKTKELKRLKTRIYLESQLSQMIIDYVWEQEYEKLLFRLDYELRQRNPDNNLKNTREELEQKKREVDIALLIQTITGKPIININRNYPCFLPDHKDKTGSFHIYPHTGTWKCFGCGKGGTGIDFIHEYTGLSLGESIKRFLQF